MFASKVFDNSNYPVINENFDSINKDISFGQDLGSILQRT